jgi:hypothetical protein
LRQKQFKHGTLRLSEPGTYVLKEDIVFDPVPEEPGLDSSVHRQGDGYFLGYFAAIAVEGDNITLDCRNHKIEMSENFHKNQRFFSVIELGSRPFRPSTGPPPFANPSMSPGPVRVASNVKILNCVLGRSAHHGIHGNDCANVEVRNTKINNFEVAGISLNNATGVSLENLDIGPSMKKTFPASLSQAIFLDHMCTGIGMSDTVLRPLFDSTDFRLRGKATTAANVFSTLNSQLKEFLSNGTGALAPLVGTKTRIDGSAIYGVLLHKGGPAVADFGAHPFEDAEKDGSFVAGAKLKNINVHDLEIMPEAWISLHRGGKQVQGPAGAVFRATQLSGWSYRYIGNALSDAQIAVGHVVKKAEQIAKKKGAENSAEYQRVKQYYEAAFLPDDVLNWAANTETIFASLDLGKFQLKCDGDAMSHHNKGAVGLRLEYLKAPELAGITVRNLRNHGGPAEDEYVCKARGYKGNDVHGVKVTNCIDVKWSDRKPSMGLIAGHEGRRKDYDETKTFF